MDSRETEKRYALAEAIRRELHGMPESSGQECRTGEYLKQVLKTAETGEDVLIDRGKWFYVLHREPGAKETLGFRADMDAVTGPDGTPYHGCGHDGHSSVMASLALGVRGKKTGKNLVFLFQHAEETGEGAKECLQLFEEVIPDCMFAFHNIPGFPEGVLLTREGTFACASKGLILRFSGKQSHAAYPELGKNPVYALGQLIGKLPEITAPASYGGMILLTPVCLNAGAKAFGVAAGEGEICFTLRAWRDEDLDLLQEKLLTEAGKLAEQEGIGLAYEEQDVFAATVNDPGGLALVHRAAQNEGLKEFRLPDPMRWSEDFGRFGAGCRICMIGIGAGEHAPGLHTPEYVWNPAVSRTALQLFSGLIGC